MTPPCHRQIRICGYLASALLVGVLLVGRAAFGFQDEGREPDMPAWAVGQKVSPLYWLEWPQQLGGSVRDRDGRPFAGAKIALDISVQLWVMGGQYEKPVFHKEVRTDQSGEYAIDTSDFPAIRHRPVVATITASAADRVSWQAWWWYGPRDTVAKPRFAKITLDPGRVLTGRVLDPDNQPAQDAVLIARSGAAAGRWAPEIVKTDKQGRFRFLAPKQTGAAIWVSSRHGAPKPVAIPPDGKEEFDIRLERGVPIEGTVLSKQNQPAPGVVLAAESFYGGSVPTYFHPFRVAARTGRDGRFRLPPLAGEYRVFVTEASTSMSVDQSTALESKSPIPNVPPRTETLMPPAMRTIEFKGTDAVTIEGRITWDNSEPAIGSVIAATMMPAGNGAGLQLASVFTDENGHYRLHVPASVERVLVNVQPQRRNKKTVRAFSFSNEYQRIEKLTEKSYKFDFQFEP